MKNLEKLARVPVYREAVYVEGQNGVCRSGNIN